MPNAPAIPPTGTYDSTLTGDLSSWSGKFHYDSGSGFINYDRTNPPGSYTATSHGQMFNFQIGDPGQPPVTLKSDIYVLKGNGMAEYKGSGSKSKDKATDDDWTATQTSTGPGEHSRKKS